MWHRDFKKTLPYLERLSEAGICLMPPSYVHSNSSKFTEAATGGVLKNFTKFKGKHLCQSLFLNEVEEIFNEIKLQTSGGLLSLNFDDNLIKD